MTYKLRNTVQSRLGGQVIKSTQTRKRRTPKTQKATLKNAKLNTKVYVKKLSDRATLPCMRESSIPGFDVHSAENPLTVGPKEFVRVHTDLRITIPASHCVMIVPTNSPSRGSLTVLPNTIIHGMSPDNLTIDLLNIHDTDSVQLLRGDRIARLILIQPTIPTIENLD